MSRRPVINLNDITSSAAIPMAEASQRAAQATSSPSVLTPMPIPDANNIPSSEAHSASMSVAREPYRQKLGSEAGERTRTEDLKPLAFKVSPAFSKRFRRAAFDADLKLNELLFEALNAWEKSRIKER